LTAADEPRLLRVGEPGAAATTSRTIVLVLGGPIDRAIIPALCERLSALLAGTDADHVVCDVGALAEPDAVTVDALARLQLKAKRLGYRIWLRHASRELRALLELTGLVEVVSPVEPSRHGRPAAGLSPGEPSPIQPGWQAEEGEHALGIEEMVEPDDPAR
jgi:ABC-type transporter Mla MlaB component